MPSEVFIGCSGFHYKEWKNVFYPEGLPQTKWLQFYCQQFNTLEINASFYKFPTVKSMQKWYDVSPGEFKFSVKAPRLITHYKRFADCENQLKDFYAVCAEGLRHKLGCILFQLHPQIKYTDEFLSIITNSVNPSFRNVLEFREASWWNETVFKTLESHNIMFCGISYPKLPDALIVNAPEIYYRFHGVPVLYKSSYDEEFLKEKTTQVERAQPNKAWIYFNNTWGISAIENAESLQKLFDKAHK